MSFACWFCNSPTCEGCFYDNSTSQDVFEEQEDEEK